MYINESYLKDFSPLMPEFCVKYLDFPKLTVERMIYQDWSYLLWCTCGYLYVFICITSLQRVSFYLDLLSQVWLYVGCHHSVCEKYLNYHDFWDLLEEHQDAKV